MIAPRTEGSALLALILAVMVLLLYRGPESSGSTIAVGLAGALAGAGIAMTVVSFKPGLFARRGGTSPREKCDEIRDLLVAELRTFEREERLPDLPIRMRRNVDQAPEDLRKAA